MGIKKLSKFLNNKGLVKKYDNIYNFKKKNYKIIVGVDTMLYMYKFKYSYNDIIYGFTRQIIYFLVNKIIPIYIFDGKPLKEKSQTLYKRKNNKKKIESKINEIKSQINENMTQEEKENMNSQLVKLNKKNIKITNDDIKKLMSLFDLCGIPYLKSVNEADILLASLYKNNKINYCLSEDMDILIFGAKKIIKFDKKEIHEFNLNHILNNLELTEDQFIDMCILFGCDYINPILKKKPNEIYDLIKKYKEVKKIVDKDYYIEKHNKIKNLFKNKSDENYNYPSRFRIKKRVNILNLLHFLKKEVKQLNGSFIHYIRNSFKTINNFIEKQYY